MDEKIVIIENIRYTIKKDVYDRANNRFVNIFFKKYIRGKIPGNRNVSLLFTKKEFETIKKEMIK